MADKSALVPVDAISNHKTTDMDVDIDDELFGKKPAAAAAPAAKQNSPAKATPAAAAPVQTKTPPPAPAAPKKFEYKKSTTYQKTYAKK